MTIWMRLWQVPPIMAPQNVTRTVGSRSKFRNRVRPAFDACSQATGNPPGTSAIANPRISRMPPQRTRNWSESVQMTAFMPPSVVYTVAARPVSSTEIHNGQAVISMIASAGA